MKHNPVGWFEIYVQDKPRAKAFYEAVFLGKLEAERAAAHGGRILNGKASIGEYGFIAMVQDTEGNTIGLHSMQ